MPASREPDKTSSSVWFKIIRVVMFLAIAGIFVGSTVLLLMATIDIVTAIVTTILGTSGGLHGSLRVDMIEAVDTILVSTVLYVIAIGLFQLFVDSHLSLPKWLHTDDVGDLERRLAGMVVTVISVIFLTEALETQDSQSLLFYGIGIAAVVAAISLFLHVEGRHKEGDVHEEQ